MAGLIISGIAGYGNFLLKNDNLLTLITLVLLLLFVGGAITLAMGFVQFIGLALAIAGLVSSFRTGFTKLGPIAALTAGFLIVSMSVAMGLSVFL